MNLLRHIVEPEALLLTWQPSDERSTTRTRRVVGKIWVDQEGKAVFQYLKGTDDYAKAEAMGFKGYPAFDAKDADTREGVIESFLRRVPPRKREDFAEFLESHRLPHPFPHSDLALLGYTGAKLPSDGFALVPVFPKDGVPCDYLLEVAGFRHETGVDIDLLTVGSFVTFRMEQDNPVDTDALAVVHRGIRIGYVNRALRGIFHRWLETYAVTASIERINGKPDRPLVYIRVRVVPRA